MGAGKDQCEYEEEEEVKRVDEGKENEKWRVQSRAAKVFLMQQRVYRCPMIVWRGNLTKKLSRSYEFFLGPSSLGGAHIARREPAERRL